MSAKREKGIESHDEISRLAARLRAGRPRFQ
jgi:hypothetical protein